MRVLLDHGTPDATPVWRDWLHGEHVLGRWRGRLIEELRGREEGFTDGHRLIPARPVTPTLRTLKEGTEHVKEQ